MENSGGISAGWANRRPIGTSTGNRRLYSTKFSTVCVHSGKKIDRREVLTATLLSVPLKRRNREMTLHRIARFCEAKEMQELLEKVEMGGVLSRGEAEAAMEELLCGRMSTAEMVRLLEGRNFRAVNAAELGGFASAMQRHAAAVFATDEERPANLVDTCGTGDR